MQNACQHGKMVDKVFILKDKTHSGFRVLGFRVQGCRV